MQQLKKSVQGFMGIGLCLLITGLGSCNWYQKEQLASFEKQWPSLRDSILLYADSLSYLPRQASTYIGMMDQDTIFFVLFEQKDIDRFKLVKQTVLKSNQELINKDQFYKTIVRRAERNDLEYQRLKRYLNGGTSQQPDLDVKALEDSAANLAKDLKIIKADHNRLFTTIRENFFMYKDLKNNLMKPHWDKLSESLKENKPLSNYPMPKQ